MTDEPSEVVVCPRCGKPVVDFDNPPPGIPTCNPITDPDCWSIERIRSL